VHVRATNAFVSEAVLGQFFRLVDIAQVDDHRLCHVLLQPLQVEGAELLPFVMITSASAPLATL